MQTRTPSEPVPQTSPVPRMRPSYSLLSAEELALRLAALAGWHGDTQRIARTVRPQDLWTLLERVAEAEAELDHHTVVDLDAGTITFTLWTHDRDAVTDADLELAQRIDQAVDAG